MAITFNIPSIQWVRVKESDADMVKIGSFEARKNGTVKNIKVGIFKNNCIGQFRLRIHTSPDCNTNYAVSNWIDIEEIQHLLFVGNIRFDFDKFVIHDNKTYYVTIESNGYTRNADSEYFSLLFDFPFPTNDIGGIWPTDFALRMEIFDR